MNIDREFIKWFYEEQYPEMGSNRRQVFGMTHGTQDINVIDYWMREAFKAGVKAANADTLETLGKYACAVAGLDPRPICPDEIFDTAQENLKYYFENEHDYEIGNFQEQQAFDKQRNYKP